MSSLPNVARAKKSRLTGLPPSLTDRGTWLPVAVFLTLVLIFSLTSPAFFSWRNLAATTGEAATLLIASLGASFVILMGSIDLSVGATVLLVATATVAGLKHIPDTNPGLLVLPFGALLGGSLGAFNGAITVFGKVPSFVVTLGSLSVFTGIALSILAGATIMFDLPIFEMLIAAAVDTAPAEYRALRAAVVVDLHFHRRPHPVRAFCTAHRRRRTGRAHRRHSGRSLQDLRLHRFRGDGRPRRNLRRVPARRRRAEPRQRPAPQHYRRRSSSAVPRSPAASAASTAHSSASRSSS